MASEEETLINAFRSHKRKAEKDSNISNNNKSLKWFNKKIKDLRFKNKLKPSRGSMLTFNYDPKNKLTLPHWDKFPLIILLDDNTTKSFLGLNLHYIKPKDRQNFLEQILKFASTKTFRKNIKFNINWSKIKNIKFSDKMIKRYLRSHVKSQLSVVPATEWYNTVYLPTQQFISNGKRKGAKSIW